MSVNTPKESVAVNAGSLKGPGEPTQTLPRRRLPVGAEVQPDGRVHFRVWAPKSSAAAIEPVEAGARAQPTAAVPLAAEGDGYFSGYVVLGSAEFDYRVRLDSGSFPDPASRFQPDGPHGPSRTVDAQQFKWTDQAWRGVGSGTQVIYELHMGTFTREGTWRAAAEHLPWLAELGVTVLEVMPVADFAGKFGWGYDGVNLFAPTRLYGAPDDFRAFVDRAHRHGLAVILDVVYNHFGPDGNYLKEFSPDYFTDRYANEWGEPINFDGPNSGPVREFFVANAGYWIEEFHLDGLRLDATQQIFDSSADHILAAISRRVREAAGTRGTFIVAENEPQHTRMVRPPKRGGYGLDALWNDDFHHSAIVAATGRAEAYYSDYLGTPQEFVSAFKWGYLFQGQRYRWQKKRRGTPGFGLEPWQFVNYLENHDQVANSLRGLRLHQLTSPGCWRALNAMLLLGPGSPMLFQGQEFGASGPFLYFADHQPELAKLVAKGRKEFLSQFPSIACPDSAALLVGPEHRHTFERCKLDWAQADAGGPVVNMFRDLLRFRREDEVLRNPTRSGYDGAVLGPDAFLIRYYSEPDGHRLLLVNLGTDLRLEPAPEPLLAPPEGHVWQTRWTTEDPRYGGCGAPPIETEEGGWYLPGQCAALLVPKAENKDSHSHGEDCPPN